MSEIILSLSSHLAIKRQQSNEGEENQHVQTGIDIHTLAGYVYTPLPPMSLSYHKKERVLMSKTSGYEKIILAVVFLVSVAAPINQFKVPPMMQQLMTTLDISFATSGWLMSVFALVGVILALPVGQLMERLGIKNTGILALLTLFVGSLIGYFSGNAAMMLTSRVIEGAGMCLISVMAPAAIAAWFPPERRGLPMGIWAVWVPLGAIIMFNIAPKLGSENWGNVWIFSLVYMIVVFVMLLVFFKMPDEDSKPEKSDKAAAKKSPYANINIWMLGLVSMVFNIMVLSISTFMPVFLQTERGFTLVKASSSASIVMIVALIIGPLTGVLIDIIKSFKKPMLVGLIMSAVMVFFIFSATGGMIYVVLILIGVSVGMISTGLLSAAPEVMKSPATVGIGMSIIMFGQNIGMFAGPAMMGTIIQSFGWSAVGYVLAPIMAVGALITVLVKMK